MEITEIKSKLTLHQVLHYYGLKGDIRSKICCPFHEDRTPSMQLYYRTNTAFCFSSNCKTNGKAMDVIDFIMYKENCSKAEAIAKAVAIINENNLTIKRFDNEMKSNFTSLGLGLEVAFKKSLGNLKQSSQAQAYCESRKLDFAKLEIGYQGREAKELRHCIIFPLRDKNNAVTGLYGRSIFDKQNSRHFYLKESKGLYPSYPSREARQLIITESIIDAASLMQLESSKVAVLACYGTNRLNEEMKSAIKDWATITPLGARGKEIVFAFDTDSAGRKATAKYSEELKALMPQVIFSTLELPCKDVNETLVAHNEEIFNHLLENRKFLFSDEKKSIEKEKDLVSPLGLGLKTSNADKLIYKTAVATYYILGGLPKTLDNLKVMMVIENKQASKSRHKVDLYDSKQVEKTILECTEQLKISSEQLRTDIEKLTDLLENYREQELTKEAPSGEGESVAYILSNTEKETALTFARDKNLLKNITEKLSQTGIIGEEENKTFLYLIAISHIQENPLNALIQGSSGSGKTNLLKGIFKTIPEESKKIYSRCSEKMLYNVPKYYFKNKLICFEDVDGLGEEAEYAWRELVSNGELISGVSYKDEKGNIGIKELTVYGPITSIACTTKGAIYADNMSRLFLLAIDESKAQTQRINEYQAAEASGLINKAEQIKAIKDLQNFARILQPYRVYNPYATKLKLPEGVRDERRLYKLYLHFIEIITVLHQHQRQVQVAPAGNKLIATKADCQLAKDLLFECIMLKMDELDGSLRQFFERLKDFVTKQNNTGYDFSQRDIRQALNVKKTQLSYYLHQLMSLEYVQQVSSHINKGNRYKIIHFDNYRKTREEVKLFLQNQLDNLEEVSTYKKEFSVQCV